MRDKLKLETFKYMMETFASSKSNHQHLEGLYASHYQGRLFVYLSAFQGV